MLITWLLFRNSHYGCQLVYARGEINLDPGEGFELVQIFFVSLIEVSGYLSTEHFLDASTLIAGSLKALI